MNTKIFIVDDHYMIIEGIRSMLVNEPGIEWLGHASSAAACLAFLRVHTPDVILMDINLPDKSGLDLCREVLQLYPSIRIIGLSTFNQLSFISRMLENGACGYLLKNAGRHEILQAIETVMQRKQYLSLEASEMVKKNRGDEGPVLTRREIEVLQLIAEGLTNAEMAEKLFVSVTTIDTHRKNLLAKFNAKNTAALVWAAAQMRFV